MISKIVSSAVFIAASVAVVSGSAQAAMLYDGFSQSNIDSAKWKNQEFVREVTGGKLVTGFNLNVDQTGMYGNTAEFVNPNTINKIQASVTVDSYHFDRDIAADNQFIATEIQGNFYQDTKGDVLAGVALIDFAGPDGLQAGCHIETAIEGVGPAEMFSTMAISAGRIYDLSIEYKQTAGQFICTITDTADTTQTETIVLDRPSDHIDVPATAYKALATIYEVQNEPDGAFTADASMFVTYDDVVINDDTGSPYDNFTTGPLDPDKWGRREIVRKITDGRLQLSQHNVGEDRRTNRIRTVDSIEGNDFYQVDIEIDGSSQVSGTGKYGQAIAGGYFYNDTYDGGYSGRDGDNYARIDLRLHSAGNMEAVALIWRCENADCSTDTTVWWETFTLVPTVDTTYTTTIEKVDGEMHFSVGGETIVYPVSGNMFSPSHAQRRLTTRVYSAPGESGYVTAFFDNVRYGAPDAKPFFWGMFLPAIQNTK